MGWLNRILKAKRGIKASAQETVNAEHERSRKLSGDGVKQERISWPLSPDYTVQAVFPAGFAQRASHSRNRNRRKQQACRAA